MHKVSQLNDIATGVAHTSNSSLAQTYSPLNTWKVVSKIFALHRVSPWPFHAIIVVAVFVSIYSTILEELSFKAQQPDSLRDATATLYNHPVVVTDDYTSECHGINVGVGVEDKVGASGCTAMCEIQGPDQSSLRSLDVLLNNKMSPLPFEGVIFHGDPVLAFASGRKRVALCPACRGPIGREFNERDIENLGRYSQDIGQSQTRVGLTGSERPCKRVV